MGENMNILIISDYFPPRNSIASLRPYSWAKFWSKMGHDVTVLTTKKEQEENDLKFDFHSFKVIEVENKFKNYFKTAVDKSVQGEVVGNEKSSLKSKLTKSLKTFLQSRGVFSTARMPDFNDFIINKSYDTLKNETYDLVISTAGPYSEHLIAQKIKEKHPEVFWIVDYRDLWTQNHIFKGLFPFTLIEEYLERKVNNSTNMITTVSEPLKKQISNKYKLSNVETIENGFDFDDLEKIPKNEFWSDYKIRLVYTGSIYKGKRDPSPLFEAIEKISKSAYKKLLNQLEVIFIGGSKADLDELIAKYHVSLWVHYGGFLSREDSLRMQRDAHALIFLEFEKEGVEGILTGKLFEYICSGTQILGIGVTDKSSPGELIAKSGHGINFGKDSDKLQNYLLELLTTEKKEVITKNVRIIEKYSREKQAESMIELTKKYKQKYD